MIKYPIEFSLGLKSYNSNDLIDFDCCKVDTPEVFGGLERAESPEDYFLVSILSCFLTTLNKLSSNVGLDFKIKDLLCKSILDRGDDGKPFVKSVGLDFCIYSTNNLELNKVIETAKTNCFIANSVKSQLNWNIKYTDENF